MLVDAADDRETFAPPFAELVATDPLPPPSPHPAAAIAAASRASSMASRRGTCSTLTHVSVPANAASGFARAPGAYERTRPGYPDEAVSWLCQELGIRAGARV